jgi:hypothetical protein
VRLLSSMLSWRPQLLMPSRNALPIAQPRPKELTRSRSSGGDSRPGTLPLGRQQCSITVDDRKPNLHPSPESHADAFVLGQDTFGNLPVEDVSALKFFVNPGRSRKFACLVHVGMSAELDCIADSLLSKITEDRAKVC